MRSRAPVTREQMPAPAQAREGWSARGNHVLEADELKHTDEHAVPSSTEHNGCESRDSDVRNAHHRSCPNANRGATSVIAHHGGESASANFHRYGSSPTTLRLARDNND
jgi:hypothetical protein